jgi:hypothetical protein
LKTDNPHRGKNSSDVNRWWHAAAKLFHEISTDLGKAEARWIFTSIAVPRTPQQEAALRNMELLICYDTMMPKPNVKKLAQQLAEANKTLPAENRYGRGSTNPRALDKHIRRLVKQRRAKQRA